MKALLRRLAACIVVPAACLASWVNAATPTVLSFTPINAVPPNVQSSAARPIIMLNMSKDHQLFYRAYNEFSDYNDDGSPDGTYLHTVRYSGYFDTTKCYTYSNTNRRYSPSGSASSGNLCSSAWHGNFLNWATMTRMDVLRKVLYGGTRSTDSASSTILERASLPMDAHSFAKYYANAGTATADRPDIHTITPFASTETEITFCNTTLGDTTTVSHTNTNPPLLRAARGNFSLWNAHERRQCRWSEETVWSADGSGNGNDPAISGFEASGNYPSRASRALGGGDNGDFTVRVEVCNAAYVGSERCRTYPDGNLKPIGLLQEYGESDVAEFGLLTGSFSNNISGGVLRKNATSFRNEVNYLSNGTFVSSANGIVGNIDRMKVYGFRYNDASYAANDNASRSDQFCDYQTIGLSNDQCASWGNPLGEMFIETLRYLGGKTPSASYGSNADAKGALMGLTVATWVDPLGDRGASHRSTFGEPQCRPINNININASVISYDRDTTAPFNDLDPAQTLANLHQPDRYRRGCGRHLPVHRPDGLAVELGLHRQVAGQPVGCPGPVPQCAGLPGLVQPGRCGLLGQHQPDPCRALGHHRAGRQPRLPRAQLRRGPGAGGAAHHRAHLGQHAADGGDPAQLSPVPSHAGHRQRHLGRLSRDLPISHRRALPGGVGRLRAGRRLRQRRARHPRVDLVRHHPAGDHPHHQRPHRQPPGFWLHHLGHQPRW